MSGNSGPTNNSGPVYMGYGGMLCTPADIIRAATVSSAFEDGRPGGVVFAALNAHSVKHGCAPEWIKGPAPSSTPPTVEKSASASSFGSASFPTTSSHPFNQPWRDSNRFFQKFK